MTTIPVHIPSAVIAEIVGRLAEVAGMAPDLLDEGRLLWTIERRRRKLCLRDGGEYLEYLKSSGKELEQLIDAMVITETAFFRDHPVFAQIEMWARHVWVRGREPLRILCAPCSTGQEAYSISAIMQQAGVAAGGFTIDAMDISRTALEVAQRGIYPGRALEDVPEELRRLCAERHEDGWAMRDEVRSRIRFERRNIVLPEALGDEAIYDLILCRNVFIYLHSKARGVLAASLARALQDGGRLILGTGDRVPEIDARFVAVKPASGFAFAHRLHDSPAARGNEGSVWAIPEKSHFPDPVARVDQEQDSTIAAEYYQRALEYSRCGNLRHAERRCRQALYLDSCFVPALELLFVIWRTHPGARLCHALEARIRRVRSASVAVAGARGQA